MKTLPLLTLAAVLLTAQSSAQAIGSLTDVTLYDRKQNRELPVYQHNGRYYVEGTPGNEYQINLRNWGGSDVLTVISVDGVNAVSGETANWDQTGYVLDQGVTTEIKGWRKSQERTAAFYFTKLKDSYASRTGRPGNTGVIGVAVFRRKVEPLPVPYPLGRYDGEPGYGPAKDDLAKQAPASGSATSRAEASMDARSAESSVAERKAARDSRLGTGHGRNEYSYVTYTDFERASSTPDEVISIYYDSRMNLIAAGIIPTDYWAQRTVPEPFANNSRQFVPDP